MTLAATSGSVLVPTDALLTSNGFTTDGGTLIVLRAMYDAATTVVGVAPVGTLLGRKKGGDATQWMPLYNKAAVPALLVTFTPNIGTTPGKDVADATNQFTTPAADHVFDAMGCSEFVFLTTTAIGTLTGGSVAVSGMQFKIL